MTRARLIIGDVFDVLATLEPTSVDLVMTSPPFLALRSYLPADHPDKAKEIGSEATPADFLDTLLDVVEALDRVLAPHGSIVIELGDSFAGSGGAGGDYNPGGLRDGQPRFRQVSASSAWRLNPDGSVKHGTEQRLGESHNQSATVPVNGGSGWPLDKSLCGIPTLFAWSLAYGRNLLRPERTTPQWRVRNIVCWNRPNPPVGALGDKFRPATSFLTVACKARDRYFDLDAVRQHNHPERMDEGSSPFSGRIGGSPKGVGTDSDPDYRPNREDRPWNAAGAPPLDYWVIPTQPYSGAHYASFPEQLTVIPVKAMCPQKVCRVCGQPSRRIVGEAEYVPSPSNGAPGVTAMRENKRLALGVNQWEAHGNQSVTRSAPTLGWSDCGHNNFRNGLVLDPFGGSGTTGKVATGHGRDAVLIDIDERNAELAIQRVGPLLLDVEYHQPEHVA